MMSQSHNLLDALNNSQRLAALHECGLHESAPQPDFERLAHLAARLLQVPMAFITLIDADRQYFLSCYGMPTSGAQQPGQPAPQSLCQYIVAAGEPLAIADVMSDPRWTNQLLLSERSFTAYLGFPLITADGFVLGSFCVIDTAPHAWSEDDMTTLHDLSAAAIIAIELRRDIRRREQVEAELYEHNMRFASAFANAAIGMALVGLEGRWIQVNQALCALLGYTEAELMTTSFQAITHPADLESSVEHLHQLVRGERSVHHGEKRYIHKRGRVVWVQLSVSLVRGTAGEPLYFVSQIQDITARKQGEWEHERLIEQLSEALDNVKVLQGLLPICAECKKIRDDSGYWNQIEGYIQQHTGAHFSHGICPNCVQKLYPDIADPPAAPSS